MKSFTWTLVFAFSLSVSAQATINKYYLPPNVNYIGCLQDSNVRILPVQKFIADVTVEKCLSSCSASNHRYSAVEFGRECWCGDTLNANILTFTGTSETQKCNIQCKGNPTQICGGTLTANVYHDLSPKIKKTGLPTTVEYLGCFQDSSQRVLPMWQSVSTLTVTNCQAACSAAKHPYSGVQCGYECWCGDTFDLGKTTNYTGSDENSKCNFQCGGDPLQICGGVWTLNVYRDSSIGTTSNVVPPPPNVVSTTGPCTSSTNCGPGRQCSIYGWCEQIPTSSVGLRGAQPIRFGNRIWFGRRIVVGNSALDGKPIITDRVYIPPNVAMKNQGGKVMNTTSFNIYVLYYGQLWNQSQKDVIEFFLSHSGSGTSQPDPWSGIADYHHLENGVHRWAAYPHLPDIKSRYHIPFNGKKELTDDDVANYINSAITSGNLAKDPVGIYLFLGGSEIRQRSSSLNGVSCVDYCGWHNWINGGGGYPPSKEMNFNYFGYVQHPGSESDSCWTQCGNRLNTANSYFGNGEHTSPNKDPPIDQMVDMIFHELAEFVTNANGNAWFDSNTLDEAADLCSEFYGVLNNDQRLWDGCKEGSRKDYFAHVPMLARYNPSQFGAYDGSKPYYYNTEIYNEAFTQKRRFLLSAIYNPVEKYWQTGGPYGNPLGCTTGYRTAYWEDWYC